MNANLKLFIIGKMNCSMIFSFGKLLFYMGDGWCNRIPVSILRKTMVWLIRTKYGPIATTQPRRFTKADRFK